MSFIQRISLKMKALTELGLGQVGLYARYRIGLYSGYYRWLTKGVTDQRSGLPINALRLEPVLNLPGKEELAAVLGEDGRARLLEEADEILDGNVRLFGGEPVPLLLDIDKPLHHWTAYELGADIPAEQDVKYAWEPGRFGWAYTLARAYYLTGQEDYADAFWRSTEAFIKSNPPYIGLHWVSAQEVALRLIALVFTGSVFAMSKHTTPGRIAILAEAVANHANRIPPTLVYARAQNNNHLLSEAVGLYTAGVVLPYHPQAGYWCDLGWQWLNHALQTQIAPDGTYVQQSTNYHRLMLQAALWISSILRIKECQLPELSLQRLAVATRWLLSLVDPGTGHVPNLGPNDGANIMPLAVTPIWDYRAVLQSAALAYLAERPFPSGLWDEMGMWYGVSDSGLKSQLISRNHWAGTPHVLRTSDQQSWAYLRAAQFDSRPGHADQLHFDLWWRGMNLAMDAGTYLYNAPPPWNNALAGTAVHNTVMVHGQDQMTRVGRFLWLDWAQSEVIACNRREDGLCDRIVAQHDGYRHLRVIHQRTVEIGPNSLWTIEDHLLPLNNASGNTSEMNERSQESLQGRFDLRLHWLLPDWEWNLDSSDSSCIMHMKSPLGWIRLDISDETTSTFEPAQVQLVRAGKMLQGDGPVPSEQGWYSPTYGCKLPSLSLSFTVRGSIPHVLLSEWRFPGG